MRKLRFRLRTLIIGIVLLAPVLAALAFGLLVLWQLHAAYGPGGILDREHKAAQKRLRAEPGGILDREHKLDQLRLRAEPE